MPEKKRHILVTGGAGFIGSHLSRALAQRGYYVTCIDNLSTGHLENIASIPSIRFIEADANRPSVWRKLTKEKFEAVFHYAATVGVKRTEEHPMKVLDDAWGLRYVTDFVAKQNVPKLVFASSSEVYGDPRRLPEREEDGTVAWSPYTAVKLFGEHLLTALASKHHIVTVSLRFFNVYGPRQTGNDYGFVVAKFIGQALRGEPITVYGDGEQTRDFVFIDDNIATALAVLKRSFTGGFAMNVGTGRETSILRLARTINRLIHPLDRDAIVFLKARPHDVRRRRADTKQMKRLLTTGCSTPLAMGLQSTIQWFTEQQAEATREQLELVPKYAARDL